MRIAVGLPTGSGATGDLLLEWARRADRGPFSSLAVSDLVVHDEMGVDECILRAVTAELDALARLEELIAGMPAP